jgi:hypothetical protein
MGDDDDEFGPVTYLAQGRSSFYLCCDRPKGRADLGWLLTNAELCYSSAD